MCVVFCSQNERDIDTIQLKPILNSSSVIVAYGIYGMVKSFNGIAVHR